MREKPPGRTIRPTRKAMDTNFAQAIDMRASRDQRRVEENFFSPNLDVKQCEPFFRNPNDKLSFIKLCTAVARDPFYHRLAVKETIRDRWIVMEKDLDAKLLDLYDDFLYRMPGFKVSPETDLRNKSYRLEICQRIIEDIKGRKFIDG